tara:strand:+ start:5236 stop:5646 length:411 start_codon:yes stop_codon:yes gene_type:complete
MVMGRPRSLIDLDKEAEALLEWANKKDSIHLAQFAKERGTYATKLYEWRDESPYFNEALKCAKDTIALNAREKPIDSAYTERMKMRDVSQHDALYRIYDHEEKTFESSLKQKEIAAQAETLDKLAEKANAGDLSQK